MADPLNPVDFTSADKNGVEKTYVLSDIPAVAAREIAALYLPSALPKVGDYAVNKAMMMKMMNFVFIRLPTGALLPLTTEALIDNHADFMQLAKVERAMIEKNFGFFLQGTISNFSEILKRIAPQLITAISTAYSAQLSPKDAQPSTNSEPSTA